MKSLAIEQIQLFKHKFSVQGLGESKVFGETGLASKTLAYPLKLKPCFVAQVAVASAEASAVLPR